MVSVMPASLGLSIELTFPMQPALVNGVMQMFFQIQACIQAISYSAIVDVDPNDYETEALLTEARRYRIGYVLIPIFLVLVVSFVCMLFVKEDLKRLQYKKTSQTESDDKESQAIELSREKEEEDYDDHFKKTTALN